MSATTRIENNANESTGYRNPAIPLILFFISLAFRLSLICKGPFNMDCLDLVLKAEQTIKTGLLQFMYGSGYPLHVLSATVGILIGKIFGSPDPFFIVNFLSVLYSSLAVPFVFGIGRILSGTTLGGIFTALIFMFNPLVLSESLYGTSHAPALLFITGTLYHFLLFMEKQDTRRMLLAAFFLGLLGATRLQDLTFLSVALSFLWLSLFYSSEKKWPVVWRGLTFFVFAAAIALSFYLPFLSEAQRAGYLAQWERFKFDSLWVNDPTFYYDAVFKVRDLLMDAISPLGLALSTVGFWFLWLKNKYHAGMLLILISFTCISLIFVSTTVMRFLLLPVTAIILSSGCGLVYLASKHRYFKLLPLLCCWILIVACLLPYMTVFQTRHNKNILPDYARWTRTVAGPDAVIIAHDDKRFFSYFGGLETLHRPANAFAISDERLSLFKDNLDGLLAHGKPVYITLIGLLAYDPELQFSNFFKKHYHMEYAGTALYEDWHLGGMYNRIFYLPLLRVYPKRL